MALDDILKDIEERKVANPPVRRNVYVADLNMNVNTDLETPDEINYATRTQVLNKPKQEYMGLKECENPFKSVFNASVESMKNVLDKVVPESIRKPAKEWATGAVATGVSLGNLSWGATKIFSSEFAMGSETLKQQRELEQSYMRREINQEEYSAKLKALLSKREQENSLMREDIAQEVKANNDEVNKWIADMGFGPNNDSKASKFFYNLGSANVSMLASLGAFALTKNPMLSIALLSTPEFTSGYLQAIEEGKSADQAMKSGAENFFWTAGTEYIGTKVLFSTLSKSSKLNEGAKRIFANSPRLSMTAVAGVEEGTQEALQSVGTDLIYKFNDISDLKAIDIIKNASNDFLFAFLSGGMVGAVTSNIQYNDILNKTKKELTALKDDKGQKVYTPEQADRVARQTAQLAMSQNIIDEVTGVSRAERDNSLSKEARNPKTIKQELEDNLKKMEVALPEIKKELMDIKTKVKDNVSGLGLDNEQAEMVAEMTQARAMMYYNAFGITPLQFYYLNELEIRVDENSDILSNGRETGYTVRFNEEKVSQAISSGNISNIIQSIRTKENLDKFGDFVNKLVNEGRLTQEQRSMIYSQLADRMNEIPTVAQVVDRVREEEVDKFNQAPQRELQLEKEQIKQQAVANGIFMKAPNGKQSNLSEELWLTVRTKTFKNWFGDWENDPQNASKVVDENGEPLVVYHGTNAEFSVFDESFSSTNTGAKNSGIGFFFTPIRSYAENIGGKEGTKNIMPVFLNIRKPLEIGYAIKKDGKFHNGREQVAFNYNDFDTFSDGLISIKKAIIKKFGEYNLENSKKWKEEIKKQNVFDGLEIMTGDSADFNATLIPVKQYVTFEPNQIKSVNNNGMFDVSNQDIFYQPAYHGTPHRFEEFSTEKIGTGEGAQAHGWGLYFAEDIRTGQKYRSRLTGNSLIVLYNGKEVDKQTDEMFRDYISKKKEDGRITLNSWANDLKQKINNTIEITQDDIKYYTGIVEKLRQNKDKKIEEIPFTEKEKEDVNIVIDGIEQDAMWDDQTEEFEKEKQSDEFVSHIADYIQDVEIERDKKDLKEEQDKLDKLNKIDLSKIEIKPAGQLFQVEIPESDVLLDEQKTFDEQPKKVQEAIQKLYEDEDWLQETIEEQNMFNNPTGRDLYVALEEEYGDKEASLLLNKYGIKGITYDGQQDGRAYVIFDDKAVKVLEKFYQGERGEVALSPVDTPVTEQTKSIITVFSGGDRSTVIHEMAHIFLRDIEIIENQGGVQDEQFKKIKKTLDKWLGKKEGQKYTKEQQEKFASGFETYMATGQAPKPELKSVFDYFKNWMSQIYNGIKNMIPITPEVKTMFDEILTLQPTNTTQTEGGNGGGGNIVNTPQTQEGGDIVPVTPDAKDLGKVERKKNTSIIDFTNKFIQPVSTRLGAIDVRLEYEMKMFEARLAMRQTKYKNASLDFLKETDDLQKKNKQDYLNFDRALKNRDINTINRITEKYPKLKTAYEKVRTMLDDIKADLMIYGVGSLENYFPRKIANIDGLISYLEGTENWSEIERAMKQSDKNYKSWSEEKKAEFVASYLQGYRAGVKTSSAHTKQRKIDTINDEMDRYYENSNNALLEYINSISNFIETAKMLKLGKDKVFEMGGITKDGIIDMKQVVNNIESVLGTYVKDLVNNKTITREQEREIAQILKARFNFQNTNNLVSVIKSIGYLTTLGNINSVITQFGDLTYSINNAGVFGTLKAIFGDKKIKMQDIGIDHPAEDFADGIGFTQKLLNAVLTSIGFKYVDSLGKNTYIATTFMKYKKMVEKNEKKAFDDISRRYGEEFAKDLIDDIKNNRLSENVYLFAHSELSRVQPISLSEVPTEYLTHPVGRVFYSLKTFWIKQFNRVITDNKRLIQEGIKEKNADKVKEGATSMARLILLFVILGAGTDMLKDLIYLRKIDLEDTILDNFLKILGISRYTMYKGREEGYGRVFLDTIFTVPVVQMFDSFLTELGRAGKGKMKLKDLRIASNIPIIGNPYYWWLGGGRTKEKKKNKRRVL